MHCRGVARGGLDPRAVSDTFCRGWAYIAHRNRTTVPAHSSSRVLYRQNGATLRHCVASGVLCKQSRNQPGAFFYPPCHPSTVKSSLSIAVVTAKLTDLRISWFKPPSPP